MIFFLTLEEQLQLVHAPVQLLTQQVVLLNPFYFELYLALMEEYQQHHQLVEHLSYDQV